MKGKPAILVVDDNVSLSRTLSLILERKGYAVSIAEDGLQAIQRVKESTFDMIFMDIRMPFMNGVEAYRRIKIMRPETVVLMMTAYAVEDLVEEAVSEGAYGVIYKPLNMAKVLALIEEVRRTNVGPLILIVDDHPGMCAILRDILIEKGCETGIANSGEEAISMAEKQAYDIMFIDLKLPTINGLETYLAIRETNPQAVAVMMTGYGQEVADLVEGALRNHAYTCLYKPFGVDEVSRLVDEIRERKR